MSLLRLYRFSPIVPDLGLQVGASVPALKPPSLAADSEHPFSPQIHYLRLTISILRHEKSRKFLLSNVLYPLNARQTCHVVPSKVSRGQCSPLQASLGWFRRPQLSPAEQRRQWEGLQLPGWLSRALHCSCVWRCSR